VTILRRFLVALALVAALPAAASGLPGVPPEGRLDFTVRKSGTEIGRHSIRFSQKEGDVIVDTEANLRVRVAFVTVYRYAQRTREIWREGKLLSLESDIDDNGTPFRLRVERRDGKLFVDGHEEKHSVPLETFPLTYWRPEMMRQSVGFDMQWGSLAELAVEPRGEENLAVRGTEMRVRRYNMKGTEIRFGKRQPKPWLDLDAWYSPDGKLVAMSFHYRGFDFDYVL
jgi:hypothetical protein